MSQKRKREKRGKDSHSFYESYESFYEYSESIGDLAARSHVFDESFRVFVSKRIL